MSLVMQEIAGNLLIKRENYSLDEYTMQIHSVLRDQAVTFF